VASSKVPERIRWAVDLMEVGPDERLLEIGCGPGVAVAAVCDRLAGGRLVAIDRSATAIDRASRRNAAHIAAGRAVLRTVALEGLDPGTVLDGPDRFDKVFAMNVNLFWVRPPTRELALVRRLLAPAGTLYLFYGYGGDSPTSPRVPGTLTDHLTAAGFRVQQVTGPSTLAVVATPPGAPA
jgi:SAM-dependent methyltransferase